MKTVFTFLLFAILFVACEDDPTSLGIDNIPPGDTLGLFELNSLETPMLQYSRYYDASLVDTTWNLGTSKRLFLGENSDLTSKMLVVFRSSVADSISEAFTANTLNIQSAWIELKPVSVFGDSTLSFDFKIAKITTDWTSSFFDKDSLYNYVLPYVEQTDISNKEITDSLITFNISNELAYQWLEGSVNDSSELNYGLLFEPTVMGKILGFQSLHSDNISSTYDYIPVAKIVIEQNSFIDTLSFYSFRDVHVVEGPIPPDNQGMFYIQGGFPIAANYFIDVSAIPENSIIVDAVLDFYYDPELTEMGSSASNNIYLALYADSTNRKFSYLSSLTKDSLENKYSGNVTSFVQLWNQDTDNQGINVYLPDEQYTLNRIAIYGPNYADEFLRPKLTIRYTKR